MKPNKLTRLVLAASLLCSFLSTTQAQLTWDPDNNLANDGGAGTWDTTSSSWESGGSNTTWTNGSDAIFGDSGGNDIISIADGGVSVGDLNRLGTNVLQFQSVTDNLGVISIKAGGATWDTGGGEIEFLNNQANDTPLSISSGDTLSVQGGGTFDTGERPAGANWTGAGATLDFTSATTVRGNSGSIGQIGTVRLAGGSKYLHERNADQGYNNNWELGAGTVAFDNRFNRNYTLNGDISGTGGMKTEFMGNRQITLTGNNTFSGGLEVSTGSRMTVDSDSIGSGDLTLSGSGILRLSGGINLGSRDLILSGAGGSIVNAGVNSLDGNVTGDGVFQIGNGAFGSNTNVLTLNGTADHTGDTRIFKGSLGLGADNALSSSSVLAIGGSNGGTSQLITNGFDAEIAGLKLTDGSSNTRQLNNNNASSESNLTINVASGETYSYNANIVGAGTINIIKTGEGTQSFGRNGGYSTALGDVTVAGGDLVWNNNTGSTIGGSLTVGAAGTLGGSGVLGDLHFDDGGKLDMGAGTITLLSTATLTFDNFGFDDLENSSWMTDTEGFYTLIEGDFTLDSTNVANFGEENALDRGDGFKVWFREGSFGYQISAIPEPSAWLLSSLAALGCLGNRRRK